LWSKESHIPDVCLAGMGTQAVPGGYGVDQSSMYSAQAGQAATAGKMPTTNNFYSLA